MIKSICLRPTYSLRKQLFVSFGTTAFIALLVVTVIGITTTSSAGKAVKSKARKSMNEQIKENLGSSVRYVSETVEKKLENFGGVASILVEATRDRIVGYPNHPMFVTDEAVPFLDIDTGRNIYPIKAPQGVPLEWEIRSNVFDFNQEEHLQGRFDWYPSEAQVSTVSSVYFMQGQCDPQEFDTTSPTYYEGCTEANNDVTTGGVVNPTSTNQYLYDKASDMAFLLKPLYEIVQDIKTIGIYFANSGAGSFLSYPGTVSDSSLTYESIGCNWMKSPNVMDRNPTTREPNPIGRNDEIQRCHPAGSTVKLREYNPLERGWCRDQAIKPFATVSSGPYLDATQDNLWLMAIGRAVIDRLTNRFIGCTLVDIEIERINQIVKDVRIGSTSDVALVRWDDAGTVVASSAWDWDTAEFVPTIKNGFDLGMGMNPQLFKEIKSLINFEEFWETQTVRNVLTDALYTHNGKLIMMHPVPPPPSEYDESYFPEFMALVSITESEAFGAVDQMDQNIETDVASIKTRAIVTGVIGFVLVISIVFIVSQYLTKPLVWMKNVASQVVGNAGESNLGNGLDLDADPRTKCSPNTEVTVLVHEFKKMMEGFSGKGASTLATSTLEEVKNEFVFHEVYRDLYQVEASGLAPTAALDVPEQAPSGNENRLSETSSRDDQNPNPSAPSLDSLQTIPAPPARRNLGENIKDARNSVNKRNSAAAPTTSSSINEAGSSSTIKSRLFLWIVILILVPLIAAMIVVCTLVTTEISAALPLWLEDVESASVTLERDSITTAALLRASFANEVMLKPIRDLHVYSRVAGWLLMGALQRSEGFTEQTTGAELCKNYPDDERSCPYFTDDAQTPCDCQWDDSFGKQCNYYPNTDTRYVQRRFYSGQSQDADPVTGDRIKTSYPNVDRSPEGTMWWSDVQLMPGAARNSSASGYGDTYSRVRVLSAMSAVELPLYNYDQGTSEKHLGTYIGLEADGMLVGYGGCDYSHAQYAHFQSTIANRAAVINADLCPMGKYGYDCRCRDWYNTGKDKGKVHVTAPYLFAGTDLVATSMTSPLIDESSNTHIGQALLDFIPQSIITALTDETTIGQGTSGFSLLTTPLDDIQGGNTIVGPGFSLASGVSVSIGDLVLPHDDVSSTNRMNFEAQIAASMKRGEAGTTTFTRSTQDGGNESVYISYAPVALNTLIPISSSDFSRGCTVVASHIYSLGFGVTESDLILPFLEIEDDLNETLNRSTGLLIGLITASAVLLAAITYFMAYSVVRPIIHLTNVVKRINNKQLDQDIEEIDGGSRECIAVNAAFEKLYKVVRFSNSAYFAGDLQKARSVVSEALELFKQLCNNKAQGVAHNNLGNIDFGIYKLSSKNETKEEIKFSGRHHFDEAVTIGTHEKDATSDPNMKGDFMKQLANRHFNRGVFLLTTQMDTAQGIGDLKIAKDLGVDALRNWKEGEILYGREAQHFEVIKSRAQGLIKLQCEGIIDSSLWDVDALLNEADALLDQFSDPKESSLYDSVSPVGRRQQVNCLRMEYAICNGDTKLAAQIATKILVEDEYVIDTVYVTAVNALIEHFKTENNASNGNNNGLDIGGSRDLNTELASLLKVAKIRQHAKNIIFCLDYSGSMAGGRIRRANQNLLMIYDDHCFDDDSVGFVRFNHSVDFRLKFPLGRKGDHKTHQRLILSQATDAIGGTRLYSAIHACVDMVNSNPNQENDTWIVALTDGDSHDTPGDVRQRIAAFNNDSHSSKIHVIVVGFEVGPNVVATCHGFCQVSDESLYIDARGGLDQMDNAFKQVASIINNGGTTMETF